MTATPLSVLVVDDERNIRSTLRACIEAEGHAVTTVDSASHALAGAEKDLFDVALLKTGSITAERETTYV